MIKRIQSTMALLMLAGAGSLAIADMSDPPFPWVVTSERGEYLFKMVPPKWRQEGEKHVIDKDAFGVAYKLGDEGEFKETWRTEGWYAFEAYLSEDGRYLVRMGPWASDKEKHTDLAVAFYQDGVLLKQYEVRELIKDPSSLEYSTSHYRWRPEKQTEPNGFKGGTFHLVTIDKKTYSFDIGTGQILTTGRDKKARSTLEIFEAKMATAKKRAMELYNASDFKEKFREHFEMTHVSMGAPYGCSLKGPAWSAYFKPLRKLGYDAQIDTVFPIIEDSHVEVELSPEEMLGAFEKAFQHPYVQARFKDHGATGIRLRIQGDRLHWDTPELMAHLKTLTGKEPKEEDLRHWAYLIVDSKQEPRYTSVYLHTPSGDLIFEDHSQSPWQPVLLDGNGKQKKEK